MNYVSRCVGIGYTEETPLSYQEYDVEKHI